MNSSLDKLIEEAQEITQQALSYTTAFETEGFITQLMEQRFSDVFYYSEEQEEEVKKIRSWEVKKLKNWEIEKLNFLSSYLLIFLSS